MGRLIVFEGADGVGKTTQLRLLASCLAERGVPHLALREPGDTDIGESIRGLLLDPERSMVSGTEALLYMAARAELVERRVRPALDAGRLVLLDRFSLSTYAYQSAGRGLDEHDVAAANRLATAGVTPDLNLLLEYPVHEGLQRAGERGTGGHDRLESSGADFHIAVSRAFQAFSDPEWQRAHPEIGPIAVIDATGAPDEVARRIVSVLSSRWPETFGRWLESDG